MFIIITPVQVHQGFDGDGRLTTFSAETLAAGLAARAVEPAWSQRLFQQIDPSFAEKERLAPVANYRKS